MKKKLIVLFIFILSLFTAVHFVAAVEFPGIVKGSTVDASGKGTVEVTNAKKGATLKLYLAEDEAPIQTVTLINDETSATFAGVDPGQYYVTSTTSVDDTEKVSSNVVDVKPSAANLKLSSTLGSTEITVTGGIPGATFTLYNENNSAFVKRTVTAANDGSQKFSNVPVGKNYRVTQKVKGAESALSTNGVDILPNKVTLVPTDAGPTNDQGTITVKGSKIGNTLNLYNKNNPNTPIDSITLKDSDTHTFTKLPAGTYYVTQIQDDLSRQSDEATIGDEQAPKITLNGSDIVRLTYGEEYQDEGVTVIDNTDTNPDLVTVGVNNIFSGAPPGTYTITYFATDSDGNESAKIKRTVIIAPKKIAIEGHHDTHNALTPDQDYGDIIIKDVMAGATLYIYQDNPDDIDDTKDTLIRTITDATEGEMTIKEILVGKDYYIIQKVNNILSDPSDRVDILDTTRPTLTLNGPSSIELVVGDRYIEQGASAKDNVDDVSELKVVIGGDIVDVNKPGTYTVTYNVSDKAGNKAEPSLIREITIRPQTVIAIGSTADLGEIGVKNAMPGDIQNLTTLILYKLNDDNSYSEIARKDLNNSETTYVFKTFGPGRYYVTQTVNRIESASSNIVEIVDIDRPSITLIGPEKLSFVLDKDNEPYYKSTTKLFSDPGATADDYIDGDLTAKIDTTLTTPNDSKGSTIDNNPKRDVIFSDPGIYTITYSVEAKRGKKADNKQRFLTVAPPKTATPASTSGNSVITVASVYSHSTTVVNLYNTYNQLIESKPVPSHTTSFFNDIPAGIGYYVTQTVNGIESAPSDPVTVSPFQDADMDKFIGLTSFTFKGINATGIIDQLGGNITITLPYGTDVKSLKAVFNLIQETETVKVNGAVQTSGTIVQDFTKPVKYTVISNNGKITKDYTVTVQVADSKTYTWADAIKKNITLKKDQAKTFALTSAEKAAAAKEGISFIADDIAIHVSPANITESSNPALTVKSIEKNNFIKSIVDDDLTWKDDLTNILEIGWGGHSGSFLQPIEVEIPDPDNQTFVRLVREDGKLYAIIQPKRYLNSRTVGLATMPGTFALLDKKVTANIIKSSSEYKLSSNDDNALIYYTTDAKHITFDRSAANQSTEGYSFNGKISDLTNNWSKYEKKAIPNPEKDLYAVAQYNQIISTVETLEVAPAEQWHDEIQTVNRSKVWSITFNSKTDKKALFSNVIYVTDDTDGNRVPVLLQLSDDGKTISIAPKQPYTSDHQYTLWIEKPIQSSSSKAFLKEPKKLTFIVK